MKVPPVLQCFLYLSMYSTLIYITVFSSIPVSLVLLELNFSEERQQVVAALAVLLLLERLFFLSFNLPPFVRLSSFPLANLASSSSSWYGAAALCCSERYLTTNRMQTASSLSLLCFCLFP